MNRKRPVPSIVLRCPKCTRRLTVPVDQEEVLCPTCGYRGERAPGDWEVPTNLDDLRPGRQPALHGQHRPTAHVLLLTILSVGAYSFVYGYKAFKEVDDQHGRLHATWYYLFGVAAFLVAAAATVGLWFLIGWMALLALVPGILAWHTYWCVELSRLQDYRAARGLRRGIGPTGYTLLTLLPVLGFLVALVRINESVAGLWQNVYRETGLKPQLS